GGRGSAAFRARLIVLFTANERLNVLHRFLHRCVFRVRAESSSAHTRRGYPRRMSWLSRPRDVRPGSLHPPYPLPIRSVNIHHILRHGEDSPLSLWPLL